METQGLALLYTIYPVINTQQQKVLTIPCMTVLLASSANEHHASLPRPHRAKNHWLWCAKTMLAGRNGGWWIKTSSSKGNQMGRYVCSSEANELCDVSRDTRCQAKHIVKPGMKPLQRKSNCLTGYQMGKYIKYNSKYSSDHMKPLSLAHYVNMFWYYYICSLHKLPFQKFAKIEPCNSPSGYIQLLAKKYNKHTQFNMCWYTRCAQIVCRKTMLEGRIYRYPRTEQLDNMSSEEVTLQKRSKL